MNKHLELVDAVNEATTATEHRAAQHRLSGYRQALTDTGHGWSGMEADFHSMTKYGEDRPMCCGVLLDWEPEPVVLVMNFNVDVLAAAALRAMTIQMRDIAAPPAPTVIQDHKPYGKNARRALRGGRHD